MRASRKRWAFLFLAGAGALLLFPVTTRQGVNFQVTERKIPLCLKGADFIRRDLEYRRLASQWSGGARAPEERTARIFERTRREIRYTPAGTPILDDHILSIITRGYGEEDQRADVFTTLAAYAGLPAFWSAVHPSPGKPERILSFVKLDGRWTIWDTAAGTGPEELATHPEVSQPLRVPELPRAYRQMPVPRAIAEARSICRRVARLGAR